MEYSSYDHKGTHAQIDDSATGNNIVSKFATESADAQWQKSLLMRAEPRQAERTKHQRSPWLAEVRRRIFEGIGGI